MSNNSSTVNMGACSVCITNVDGSVITFSTGNAVLDIITETFTHRSGFGDEKVIPINEKVKLEANFHDMKVTYPSDKEPNVHFRMIERVIRFKIKEGIK